MRILFSLIMFLFPVMGTAYAIDCSVQTPCTFFWNANTETDLEGYRFYVKPVGGVYGTPLDIKSPQTAIGVEQFKTSFGTLEPGDYIAAVTAYDKTKNESAKSNEILFSFRDTVAPSVPTLQILVTVP